MVGSSNRDWLKAVKADFRLIGSCDNRATALAGSLPSVGHLEITCQSHLACPNVVVGSAATFPRPETVHVRYSSRSLTNGFRLDNVQIIVAEFQRLVLPHYRAT